MCIYTYTPRQCADRAARRVLHVAFNHDKGSFYIRLLEEVTDRGNCQEKRVPTCCPEDANAPRGEQPVPPPHTQPGALPGGARFPTTSTRHNYTGQTVKRPCSQQRFAIKIAFLPILLLRAERCGGVEAPPDRCLGLNP